jgi:hypothetical protein
MAKLRIVIETTPDPRLPIQTPHKRARWIALISLAAAIVGLASGLLHIYAVTHYVTH